MLTHALIRKDQVTTDSLSTGLCITCTGISGGDSFLHQNGRLMKEETKRKGKGGRPCSGRPQGLLVEVRCGLELVGCIFHHSTLSKGEILAMKCKIVLSKRASLFEKINKIKIEVFHPPKDPQRSSL